MSKAPSDGGFGLDAEAETSEPSGLATTLPRTGSQRLEGGATTRPGSASGSRAPASPLRQDSGGGSKAPPKTPTRAASPAQQAAGAAPISRTSSNASVAARAASLGGDRTPTRSAVRTAGGAVTDSPGGATIRTTTTVHETITVTASRPVSGAGGARGAGPSAAAAATAAAQQYSDADDSVDAYLMRTSVQFKGPFTPRVSPTDKTLEDRPRETRHIEYSDDDSPTVRKSRVPEFFSDGERQDGSTWHGRKAPGFGPPGMHDTLLAAEEANEMVKSFQNGIRHAGWLYKLIGKTPSDMNWKRYWFFIAEDRLYYTADPEQERTTAKTRYIPLDRMPVRPLPHRRRRFDPTTLTVPDLGVAIVDNRVLAHLGVKLKPNTCFGLVSGRHTFFLASDTPEEARSWIKALRATWLHCYKHTLRGVTSLDGRLQETSRLLANNQLLSANLKDMEAKAAGADSEYWKSWLEEKARNRLLEERLTNLAVYEVEVKTGKMKGSATDARVYLEMFGPYDSVTTGEIRLVNADSHQKCFTRGALDWFLVTCKNVGLPNVIKVWHDNSGRHPGWFLEYIRIRKHESLDLRPPKSKAGTLLLKAGGGSKTPGPKSPRSRLLTGGMVTAGSPGGMTVVRSMTVTATSVSAPNSPGGRAGGGGGAGTVWPAPGQVVGMPGPRPKGGAWTVFPCSRWFSTELDDCRISRMLYAGHSTPLIQYKVETTTSDLRGAGTEANVHLIMHGTLGDGKRHLLTSGHDDFNRGSTNVFIVDDEELGELLEATVGHDNTGYSASWHLDHMAITNMKTGQRFLFPCRQWFDTRIGDGLIERRLAAALDLGKMGYYTFHVVTSDVRGAGTDADVHVALHGDLGDTPTTILPSRPEHFERGETDTFRLQLPWVGRLRTLTIGHNNKGPGPEWHLQMVEVLDEEANRSYYFNCNKWLGLGIGDNLLERTLVAEDEDPRHQFTTYKLDFFTSTLRGAGTDATVYFQLFGDKGESEVQRIVAPREAFERGTVDSFSYRMPFLGKLRKLIIQHDNTGANPAWHLFKVDVFCAQDKTTTVFVCNDWIRSDDPSVYPSIELVPGLPVPTMLQYRLHVVTADLRGAGTTSNVFVELHGVQGKIGPVQLDNPNAFARGQVDPFDVEGIDLGQLTKLVVTLEAKGKQPLWNLDHIMVWRDASLVDSAEAGVYFPCRQWFDKERGMSKELFPMIRRTEEKVEFRIRVFTSDMKGAGTDANIDINLLGEGGETGYHPLVANYDTFEKGAEDVFPVEMRDVGRPTYLIVRSDGSSKKPTWHLDMVIVECSLWPPAYFLGQTWLGPSTNLAVKLPVSWENPRDDVAMYTVHVYTSDVKNAGTDAGIYLEILGSKASSGKHALLDMSKDTFEKGQMDEFKVSCRNLGVLRAIRIESDGRSAKPNWHLDRVVIIAPSGETYFFLYGDWIMAPRLRVEIPASLLDPTLNRRLYKIVTLTSNLPGADTDANVFIDIHGTSGATGKLLLKNASKSPFERGQADEFELQWTDLGNLYEIIIGHDGSGRGPSWHLEQVEITDTKTGQIWYFECNNWLDEHEGDGKLERLLPAQLHNPRSQRNMYYIVVKTDTAQGSGTDANVYVDIMGDQGSTGKTVLRNSSPRNFETGQIAEFNIQCRNLGNIAQMLLGHDGTGFRPAWKPQVVSVTDLTTHVTYWFDANMWFDRNQGDGLIERVLMALPAEPRIRRLVTYQVVVVTSDVAGAGTDARVHLIMYSQDGTGSGRLSLDKPGVDLFERGQRDVFDVQSLELDPLYKIRIGHDNSGQAGSWHLAYVEITNRETGQRYHFPGDRWLSLTDGERQLECELFPGEPKPPPPPPPPLPAVPTHEYTFQVFTSDISGAGTDADVFVVLYGDGGETPPLKLDNPKNNFERGDVDLFVVKAHEVGEPQKLKIWHDNSGIGAAWHLDMVVVWSNKDPATKYYFYCGQWLSLEHGIEKILPVSFDDPRLSMPTYTVTMHTSNIKGAGTDAKVSMNLFGSIRESGARELTGSGNLFEQGKSDVFKFKMPDLGELKQMEVWHDNGGLGPGWHLDYAEVHCSTTGKVVYFPCSQWFDKKEGDGLIRRMLFATLKDPRTFKAQYRVTTWTSDIRGAGTDANVFIQIYGDEAETGRINLDNPGRNDFEQGQMDVFEVEDRNVGKMTKIRIGHDNSGFGAAWHLDRVVVENKATGESATFLCGRWFSRNEDDGQIERELLPSFTGGVNWRLVVVTGQERGAGTDADVFVELFGTEGSFGPYQLSAQKGAFETGCRDVFSLTTPDIGQITAMALSHNDKGMGAAWQVDTAELEKMSTGEKWYFDFKVWLDKARGLRALRKPWKYVPGGATSCDYHVEVTTGPNNDSRLELPATLSINIMGNKGATDRQLLDLPQQGMQPNRIEAYALLSMKDTGSISQLEVLHTGREPWFLAQVLVLNQTTGVQGLFVVNKLIMPNTPTLLDAAELAPVDYKFEVKTTDRFKSGTSARVFFNLFGVQGSTGRLPLEGPNDMAQKGTLPRVCGDSDKFRRNGLDTFVLRGQSDVGRMTQLEMSHDDSGLCPGWHLAWVRVTNMSTGASALFPCDQWLARDEADKQITRLLDAQDESPGQQPASAVATVSVGNVPFTSTLLRKMGGTVGPPGYRITFHTSNVVMAGTSAAVFFELIGENGSSSTILTKPVPGQFSRGCEDVFVYPRMPFLGEILQMRVGTSGEGMFATWHLRSVEVAHIASGDQWVLPCHAWIDKKCGWVRTLTAARGQGVAAGAAP